MFKIKATYLKLDSSKENGVEKVSEVRLFEAMDYVDAQTQATNLINKIGCSGECDLDIQKVSYDKILTREESEEELYYYEVRVSETITNDKGEEKITTEKYIVAGEDLEDALDSVRHDINQDENTWWFTSAAETPIEEIVLLNK